VTHLVALEMLSEGNATKNREPILGFPFRTMRQHTGRWWSRALSNNDMTTVGHPPYSPHLAPADFYLFPRLKSPLKGRRCCDVIEIIKNATKELKSLSQNGFQECFQHPYSRWQKCKVAQGQYFEGNIVKIIVLLLYFRSKVIPGIF
jgi:transposase